MTLSTPLPASKSENLPGAVYALIAPLMALALALASPAVFNDADSFWHLAAGQWIVSHGAVPTTDVFSFSAPDAVWHAHEWLTEILFAGAYKLFGWSGLAALSGLAIAGALTLVARRALRDGLTGLPLLAVMLLSLSLITPSLLVRPHLFGLLLLAFWVDRLLAARDANKAPPLWLAAVMLLWVNMHASFLLGLALVGPFALEALIEAPADKRLKIFRDWTVFGALAALLALVNPQGFHAFVYPVYVMNMKMLASIIEWRPTDFSHLGPMEIALLALIGLPLLKPVRVKPMRVLILLGLVHMALHQGRQQMVFAIVAPLLLAAPLAKVFVSREDATPARDRKIWAGALALVALMVGARLSLPIQRVDGPTAPLSALAAVPPELRAKPVLNELGFGGLLISSGVKPFIDGRTDMYGDPFWFRYEQMLGGDEKAFDAGLTQYRFEWTLLPPAAPLNKVLAARPEWKKVYGDAYAVVYARE
ncbi:hypothetical protein GJ654_08010 [Rhodoblastus acidophilus]|uniref:4-amino-4-deoxy-L-arabinose transferase n=1 Tax=Rhodoblastus acidophilus TaxID=1074 RepID=A0A6N8DKM2_RHOAC|nr:DUF3488 domain-containing protein [Rhodoblastus acidophilus]MCW2273921.1 hypothetical protein [Rhodoblastus acidophilus]MTV30937.1 hypothetical protein [Rhodoblastus acidophilus]